jgi:hypothetical protein
MPTPSEYKTVQACILAYAQEIGWAFVSREEVEHMTYSTSRHLWRKKLKIDCISP